MLFSIGRAKPMWLHTCCHAHRGQLMPHSSFFRCHILSSLKTYVRSCSHMMNLCLWGKRSAPILQHILIIRWLPISFYIRVTFGCTPIALSSRSCSLNLINHQLGVTWAFRRPWIVSLKTSLGTPWRLTLKNLLQVVWIVNSWNMNLQNLEAYCVHYLFHHCRGKTFQWTS